MFLPRKVDNDLITCYTILRDVLSPLPLLVFIPPPKKKKNLSGLVDALRCLQWLLWLACLSVLDCHSLDSVGQELISRERHEHSHPSRGGHSRHLIPGHGCGLRVSNADYTLNLYRSHVWFPLYLTFLHSFLLQFSFFPQTLFSLHWVLISHISSELSSCLVCYLVSCCFFTCTCLAQTYL